MGADQHGGLQGRRLWAICGLLAIAVLAGACVSEQSIKKQNRESEGYYKEGVSFLATDRQRAYVSFQKAIALNPQNYDAHYALGDIYFQKRELKEAEREFRTCTELDPNNGEAWNYLGRTLIELSRLPEAIDVLKRAAMVPIYGTPDKAYTNLGYALQRQGDIPGAIRAYQDALKIDPPSVPQALLYLELGRLHIKQGEPDKARAAFAQAQAIDPEGTAGAEASRLILRLGK